MIGCCKVLIPNHLQKRGIERLSLILKMKKVTSLQSFFRRVKHLSWKSLVSKLSASLDQLSLLAWPMTGPWLKSLLSLRNRLRKQLNLFLTTWNILTKKWLKECLRFMNTQLLLSQLYFKKLTKCIKPWLNSCTRHANGKRSKLNTLLEVKDSNAIIMCSKIGLFLISWPIKLKNLR